MNAVDRVKEICKNRKIPISKLERDLGYANGYISQLRKGKFPTDRSIEIANYLSVSHDYILNGEIKENASAESDRRMLGNPNQNIIRIAGRDGSYRERTVTDEQLALFAAMFDQLPDVPDDL